jgi:hypothetical protein
VPDNIYSTLVGSVKLNEVIPPGLPEDLLDNRYGGGCLANARWSREEQMRQVLCLNVGLKTLDYIVLADDVVQLLRPVLLNPDLLFDNRPLPQCFELSIYQHFRFAQIPFQLNVLDRYHSKISYIVSRFDSPNRKLFLSPKLVNL